MTTTLDLFFDLKDAIDYKLYALNTLIYNLKVIYTKSDDKKPKNERPDTETIKIDTNAKSFLIENITKKLMYDDDKEILINLIDGEKVMSKITVKCAQNELAFYFHEKRSAFDLSNDKLGLWISEYFQRIENGKIVALTPKSIARHVGGQDLPKKFKK